jgi:apolipoprotein N-acyltransferase
MKDFPEYLKKYWWFFLITGVVHFFWIEAYVYPTLTFDLSVAKNPLVWLKTIFAQLPFMVVFYFLMWRPNREKLKRKKSEP